MLIKSKLITCILLLFISIGCTEKTQYFGKILNNDIDFNQLNNKKELIINLGQPSYIDPIENKYFYYSEKKLGKNIYTEKIVNREILIFSFNTINEIISVQRFNLDDEKEIVLNKDKTKNDIIKRGLIEKIFGGVGKNTIPNTQ